MSWCLTNSSRKKIMYTSSSGVNIYELLTPLESPVTRLLEPKMRIFVGINIIFFVKVRLHISEKTIFQKEKSLENIIVM